MAPTRIDHTEKIEQLRTKHVELLDKPEQISEVQHSLRQAQIELRTSLLRAKNERKKFLQKAQTTAIIASNPKEALKWKNILNQKR